MDACVALDEGQTHHLCGVKGCGRCHCHDCALALERQRNLAEETLTRVETERLAAVRERDEARGVACRLWELACTQKTLPTLMDLRDRHPWLKEKA